MKFLEATFKGMNGTRGYTNGQKYLLAVEITRRSFNRPYRVEIWRCKAAGASVGYNEYNSMNSFLENWDIEKIL